MEYLKKSGIRGVFDFTTQHIARPHNLNDREIYCMAIKMLQKGQRLKYTDIPEDHQKHKNKKVNSKILIPIHQNLTTSVLTAYLIHK